MYILSKAQIHRSRPYTSNRQLSLPLSFPIHSKPLHKHTHGNFSHRIGRLAPEKSRVDRWTDGHYSSLPPIFFEVREAGLDCSVETLGIDPLHQLETLHRGSLDRVPPYSTRVVDDSIDAVVGLDSLVDE